MIEHLASSPSGSPLDLLRQQIESKRAQAHEIMTELRSLEIEAAHTEHGLASTARVEMMDEEIQP